MKIKFLGQNCFLFKYNGKNILTDPFYNFQKEKSGFDIEAQEIHFVLITHAHEDHTADVREVLVNHPDAAVIGQPEICGYFEHKNSIDLNLGGSYKIDDLTITMVPASHTSSFPDGTYGGVPCGYIFSFEGKNIYFAGDTGVITDMAVFPKLYGEISAAILPVGGHYTMCAEKAAFASDELLKTKRVIGCHFDTFPPISIDHHKAHKIFGDKGIDFSLPELGEEFEM